MPTLENAMLDLFFVGLILAACGATVLFVPLLRRK